ncbi:DeoR/GlpR family DNA-binding transcription regulator [Enterococcus sp. LJL120]
MYATERKQAILQLIERDNSVSVEDLAQEFQVSPVTIRSDLKDLQEQNLLVRTHGGATKLTDNQQNMKVDTEYETRKKKNITEKQNIAKKALAQINEGDCIILDASSTCYELAKLLLNQPLRITILTSGLRTANLLKESNYFTVVIIGGIVKANSNAIESTIGIQILDNFSVDAFFTSSYAISTVDGLSDFSLYEAELKKEFVQSAEKTIALVDHSKFDKKAIVRFCPLDKISLLISDDALPENLKQSYRQSVKVL